MTTSRWGRSSPARRWTGSARAGEDAPFFLYFATTNIHHPFTPAKKYQGSSKAGRYGDFIHELDWIVGEVMKALDDSGVAGETLLIFTSDNGGMLNRGGQEAWRSGHRLNGDLLGFKFDAWESGHRVPFIARWPGKIEPGSTSAALLSNVDLLATVAALAGREIAAGEAEDSVDLLPALAGSPDTQVRDRLLIAPFDETHLALRQGDWIYIGAQGHGGFAMENVGDHGFGGAAAQRFTGQVNSDIENGAIRPDAPPAQLYNLADDPYQKENVIAQHPEIAAELKAELDNMRAQAAAGR